MADGDEAQVRIGSKRRPGRDDVVPACPGDAARRQVPGPLAVQPMGTGGCWTDGFVDRRPRATLGPAPTERGSPPRIALRLRRIRWNRDRLGWLQVHGCTRRSAGRPSKVCACPLGHVHGHLILSPCPARARNAAIGSLVGQCTRAPGQALLRQHARCCSPTLDGGSRSRSGWRTSRASRCSPSVPLSRCRFAEASRRCESWCTRCPGFRRRSGRPTAVPKLIPRLSSPHASLTSSKRRSPMLRRPKCLSTRGGLEYMILTRSVGLSALISLCCTSTPGSLGNPFVMKRSSRPSLSKSSKRGDHSNSSPKSPRGRRPRP